MPVSIFKLVVKNISDFVGILLLSRYKFSALGLKRVRLLEQGMAMYHSTQ